MKNRKLFVFLLVVVSCLIVIALAIPLFTHLPEMINSFAAGWGEESGQPFDTTDFLLDTTDSLNETTERPKFEQPETSQALTEPEETTEEKKNEVLDVSPVYWHFIPELEAISTEEMLAVQKAWETYSCEIQREWYYNVYIKNYGGEDGYTEEKILEMVNNSVEEFYQSRFVNDKNNYFHSRRFRSKGYLGKFSECIVLYDVAESRVIYDRQPQMIGQHDIYYDVYYVYKDGKIYTLQEAYTLGYITDEHMPKIMERKEIYKPLALNYAPSDYESIKDINKSNVTE